MPAALGAGQQTGAGRSVISLAAWLKIRDRVDRYFRAQALKPGGVRVVGRGGLQIDVEDIEASESAKQTRRAAYFVLDPAYLPYVSPTDVRVMRESLDDPRPLATLGHVCQAIDGRFFLDLAPGACEALGWRERDRVGARRLFSGELLVSIDRRART